ncbi:MAG: MerR family transcriptional regulator, partial [Proteobacteria bacterium]|nr:MerR family transcriptional regulator [Pseudomonadota bacterium]
MAITADRKSFYKIGELSKYLGVEPSVIRYWESLFTDIRPEITGTNRKLYTRNDLEMLAVIRYLVKDAQFSIDGAKQRIAELKHSGDLSELKVELVEYRTTSDKIVGSLAALSQLVANKKRAQKAEAEQAESEAATSATAKDSEPIHAENELQNVQDELNFKNEEIASIETALNNNQDELSLLRQELEKCQSELISARSDSEASQTEIDILK